MFGKPEWFRVKRIGWGLTPITWQGWIYTLIWTLVLCAPFLALLSQELVIEGMIWIAAAMVALCWDVRTIMKAIQATRDRDVLYIGDDEHESQRLATKRFDFRWRN